MRTTSRVGISLAASADTTALDVVQRASLGTAVAGGGFSLVQLAKTLDPGESLPSQTVTFDHNVKSGNVVVLFVLTYPYNATYAPSGLGASWHLAATSHASDNAGLDMWVGNGANGSGAEITVAVSGGDMENVLVACEFAGLDDTKTSWSTDTNTFSFNVDITTGTFTVPDGAVTLAAIWTNLPVNPPSSDGVTVTQNLTQGAWIELFDPTDASPEQSGLFISRLASPADDGTAALRYGTSAGVTGSGVIAALPLAG